MDLHYDLCKKTAHQNRLLTERQIELAKQLETKTYRDLQSITGLNLKQINRIVKGDTEIKINSLIRACNKLLSQNKSAKNGTQRFRALFSADFERQIFNKQQMTIWKTKLQ